MPLDERHRTFISYSRIDKDFALRLALELRSSGFDIWLDQLDIPTGARWDDEVERALKECKIFMVILTPASSASDNVKDEIGYAIDTGKHILPILLEDADVPLRLRRFQYVDFTNKSYAEGVEGAKQLLRRLVEEQTGPLSQRPAGQPPQVHGGPKAEGLAQPVPSINTTISAQQAKKAVSLPLMIGTGTLVLLTIVIFGVANMLGGEIPSTGKPGENLSSEKIADENPPLGNPEGQTSQPSISELTLTAESASAASAETPTSAIRPTESQFKEQYALLADASEWPLAESESFDVSNPDWLRFENREDSFAKHTQRIENGKLLWGVEAVSPDIWYWQVSPYFSYRDFYLSLNLKRNLGADNNTLYGLIFRKQGDKFYLFRINDLQRFAVQFINDGNWTNLIGWTKTQEIEPGKFNELTVIANKSVMTFFINKVYVGSVNDDAIDNGEVGFTVGIDGSSPEIFFEFDDFELREKP